MKSTLMKWIWIMLLFPACNKAEFLGTKPNSAIVVPTRLEELRGLLDDEARIIETPLLGIQSSDEYYWEYAAWQSASGLSRSVYTWASNTYEQHDNSPIADWNNLWHQVFIANVVLDGLADMPTADQSGPLYEDVKGAALFTRAKAMFALAEVFCLPYDEHTAGEDLGLPIRLSPNINEITQRSNLRDTYRRVLDDLQRAAGLLQATIILANRIRPTKVAAYALLARVSLSQRNYGLAGAYADTALSYYDVLLDFNTVTDHFVIDHPEAIYQNRTTPARPTSTFTTASGVMHIDSTLYALYDENDLRRTLYYKDVNGRITIKRTYSGTAYPFTGLAVDELYLIRAECNVRSGKLPDAEADINRLLENRYQDGKFLPINFTSHPDALDFVLNERRKELAFRGARWSDVRRLNKEGRNISFKRMLNGQEYTLPPNDPRFALLIPTYETALSGLQQNHR